MLLFLLLSLSPPTCMLGVSVVWVQGRFKNTRDGDVCRRRVVKDMCYCDSEGMCVCLCMVRYH